MFCNNPNTDLTTLTCKCCKLRCYTQSLLKYSLFLPLLDFMVFLATICAPFEAKALFDYSIFIHKPSDEFPS